MVGSLVRFPPLDLIGIVSVVPSFRFLFFFGARKAHVSEPLSLSRGFSDCLSSSSALSPEQDLAASL